jgi:hypothetical protein
MDFDKASTVNCQSERDTVKVEGQHNQLPKDSLSQLFLVELPQCDTGKKQAPENSGK